MLVTRLEQAASGSRGSRWPSAWTRRCDRSGHSRRGSRPSGRWAHETDRRDHPHVLVGLRPARRPRRRAAARRPRPAPRHRLHPAHRRAVPGLPDLLAARAAQGTGRGAGRPLLPGRSRRRLPGSGSWACSRPSTTTDPRSSEGAASMTGRTNDQEPLRKRHRPAHRRGHQGRPDRRGDPARGDQRVRRHGRDPRPLHARSSRPTAETPNKPHEGIGVWVSGFFGSGKSSFAKMLGLAIENRVVAGDAGRRSASRSGPATTSSRSCSRQINEQIPTHAVIFDVSTDRGIRSGNQTLTEIMYGLFLQSLGYAKDLDLSELEIALEQKGELAALRADATASMFEQGVERRQGPDRVLAGRGEPGHAPARPGHVPDRRTPGSRASRTGPTSRRASWRSAHELMKRRRPGQTLMFVVDEVGQFVARDVQKMLDLQAVVQSLGASAAASTGSSSPRRRSSASSSAGSTTSRSSSPA